MQVKSMSKTLIITLLISLLVGCSSIKLGYRFLDNAIRWEINDYVTLTPQQSVEVTKRINTFHRWHQMTQLSTYAAFMGRKAVQFQQPTLTVSDVSKIADEAFALASISLDELVPVIADMLLSLTPEQIPTVIKNLEKESAKDLKKDFDITPAQRLVKRQNKMIKRVTQWTGRLTKGQLGRIAEWAKALPVDKAIRVERQANFVSTLSKQLKDRSNPEQFKRSLLAQVKTPKRFSSAAYQQSYAQREQQTMALIADLYNSLTPNQKARLIASTKKYQADFRYLAPKQ